LKYEKWDGTPLPPFKTEEETRAHFGMGPDDVAYIIRDDSGNIIYFQHHVPFVQGIERMKETNWEEIAKMHLNRINKRLAAIEKAKAEGTFNTSPE